MTKKELREQYLQQRLALPPNQRSRLHDLLLIQFQQLVIPDHVTVLLSYWPLEKQAEVNTFLMADYLQFRMPGLQIAYPVVDFANDSMQARLVDDDSSFALNKYGIGEPMSGDFLAPTDIDLIFVPLLAFDRQGHRVGYGKGFYDRFLGQCREDSLRIGFSYFEPVDRIDGISQFDVPLTTGITPGDIYEF